MLYVKFGYDEPGDAETVAETVSVASPGYITIGNISEGALPEQLTRAELWFLVIELGWLLDSLHSFLLDKRCKKWVWSEVHEHITLIIERRKRFMFAVRIETRADRKLLLFPDEDVVAAFKRGIQDFFVNEYTGAASETGRDFENFEEVIAEFETGYHKFIQTQY